MKYINYISMYRLINAIEMYCLNSFMYYLTCDAFGKYKKVDILSSIGV